MSMLAFSKASKAISNKKQILGETWKASAEEMPKNEWSNPARSINPAFSRVTSQGAGEVP